MLHAAEQVLAAGGRIVYIDFEDSPRTIVARLLALGAEPEAILARFAYLRPDEPLDEAGRAALNAACRPAPTLAVLDGMTEALALHGLDLRDNGDVAGWINRFPRPLARLGAAVVTVDHVVKDREGRGRYAIGAQHKLAGVDVAYTLESVEAFGRNRSGRSKVLVAKDRHGHIREHATGGRIADLTLESHADGRVTVTLTTPEAQDADTFRPTVLMERVAAALEQTPGLSKRAVRTAVKGKNDTVDLALEILVAEGYVSAQRDGQTVAHHPIRPYPDPDRAPVPPPTRAQGTGHGPPSQRPPCPNRRPRPRPLRSHRSPTQRHHRRERTMSLRVTPHLAKTTGTAQCSRCPDDVAVKASHWHAADADETHRPICARCAALDDPGGWRAVKAWRRAAKHGHKDSA